MNEPASHGFLKFRVAQKPGVPLGAVIANTAAIYFDFNAPVITNSAWHTIGHNFVPTGLSQAGNTLTPTLQVSPNPAPAGAGALWIGGAGIEQGELTLYNALGRPVAQAEIENNHAYVQLQLLPPGIYQVRVFEQARLIGWSRLFIE